MFGNRFRRPSVWLAFWLVAGWVVLAETGSAADAPRKKRPLPQFTAVEQAVRGYFASQPDHRPNDLISQAQVKGIFKLLEAMGWKVKDQKQIQARVLPEQAFLVRQLRSEAGRKFMRQIAKYPDAYDRLDRLAGMPHGKDTIRRLIKGPDGYKLLQYMTTTSGGKELGKMLSRTPTGHNFNQRTQRIYTLQQLLAQLKQSYNKARSAPAS